MRLKKAQKEATIEWVAEGLDTPEINERASQFSDPFEVSRAQVDYYRRTRKVDIEEIRHNGEYEALNTGLAKRTDRVEKLKALADELYNDLMVKGLTWTEDVKGVGSGTAAMVVDYLEFNKAEIDAFRGLLDDIAKEMGDRAQKLEHSGKDGGDIVVNLSWGDDAPIDD